MSSFKVNQELKDSIIRLIMEANWYVKSAKYGTDLDIEEMYMEDGDKVVEYIVEEVINHLSTLDAQNHQLRRIADSLEKLTGAIDQESGDSLWIRGEMRTYDWEAK